MSYATAIAHLNAAKGHVQAQPPDVEAAGSELEQAREVLNGMPGASTSPLYDIIAAIQLLLNQLEEAAQAIIDQINSIIEDLERLGD